MSDEPDVVFPFCAGAGVAVLVLVILRTAGVDLIGWALWALAG